MANEEAILESLKVIENKLDTIGAMAIAIFMLVAAILVYAVMYYYNK